MKVHGTFCRFINAYFQKLEMSVLGEMSQNSDIEFDDESDKNEEDMVFVPPKCMAEIEEDINLSRKYPKLMKAPNLRMI